MDLHNPIVAAVISGVLVATLIDRQAFASFKSFNDFVSYSWSLAAWRAVQGAVIGAGTATGISFF